MSENVRGRYACQGIWTAYYFLRIYKLGMNKQELSSKKTLKVVVMKYKCYLSVVFV